MRPAPTLPFTDSIRIRPWPDEVIDALGHDPRSAYVETYWLSVLGPSTTWLLRLFAATLDEHPEGAELDLTDTAAALGLAGRVGPHSPFMRAVGRCIQFGLASLDGDGALAVRRRVPPLTRRQLVRLPAFLQEAHERWQQTDAEPNRVDAMRTRARQLALSLVQLGEDLEATERQLMHWKFHPAICSEAARWAWERHSSDVPAPQLAG